MPGEQSGSSGTPDRSGASNLAGSSARLWATMRSDRLSRTLACCLDSPPALCERFVRPLFASGRVGCRYGAVPQRPAGVSALAHSRLCAHFGNAISIRSASACRRKRCERTSRLAGRTRACVKGRSSESFRLTYRMPDRRGWRRCPIFVQVEVFPQRASMASAMRPVCRRPAGALILWPS